MKSIKKYAKIYIILIAIFILLLTIVAIIPTELIKKNVVKSATTLYEETEYLNKEYFKKLIVFDNYTDAIMINNAYSMDPMEQLYSALIVRRNYIPGITTEILEEEIGTPTKLIYETQNLYDTVQGKNIQAKQYPRYWHGYLIFLKPLLIIFDYSQIRIIQLIIFIILTVILIYGINKKIGIIEAIIFLLSLAIVDAQYIYMSLEFTPVFIIMLVTSIFILIYEKKIKDIRTVFFISGMESCFFDFLTAPIITLGVPLIVYFLLKQKNKNMNLKESIKLLFENCIIWFIGYSLTWLTKFLIVDILYDKNLLITGIKQALYRTIGTTNNVILSGIFSIMTNLHNCSIWILGSFCISEVILYIYTYIRKSNTNKIRLEILLPYILISLIPFIWYLVLQEHSARHVIFTYRSTLIAWIGIMTSINLCVMSGENRKDK